MAEPEWRTDTVKAVARGVFESRDYSALPILADALQDADYPDEDVLAAMRAFPGATDEIVAARVVALVASAESAAAVAWLDDYAARAALAAGDPAATAYELACLRWLAALERAGDVSRLSVTGVACRCGHPWAEHYDYHNEVSYCHAAAAEACGCDGFEPDHGRVPAAPS